MQALHLPVPLHVAHFRSGIVLVIVIPVPGLRDSARTVAGMVKQISRRPMRRVKGGNFMAIPHIPLEMGIQDESGS